MLPQDTIQQHTQQPAEDITVSEAFELDSAPQRPMRPQTPYQVLRMLPKDATPAQQDSAIQAWFQPGEIHYSDMPDTLHLPGHGVGHSVKDVNLPKYYKENFFSNDTLYHSELKGGRYGVAGDPVPYTIRGDNTITILLLLCFAVIVISSARANQFFLHQVKNFFYVPRTDSTLNESPGELRLQAFLMLHTSLQLGLLSYLFIDHYIADAFVLDSPYQLIAILFGLAVGYFLVKSMLYTAVNSVFFGSKKNGQWMKSLLFITSLEGILLFPAVLVQVYFDFPIQNTLYYFISVLVFSKILTFYKCWVIFFRQTGVFLQIILYFCALEIIPLLALGGAVSLIVNELKINF